MENLLIEPAYKGIVFDLDGTLINSIEDLTDSLNVVLDYYDLPPRTYQEARQMVGRGLRNLIIAALPRKLRHIDSIVDEALAKMMEEYQKRLIKKTKPYDDIPFVLGYLNRHGIPFSVCSNKADEFVRQITETLFPDVTFAEQYGMHASMPRKPDPTQTFAILKDMGLAPEECLYIGDSVTDYQTAQNAGMQSVLCSWGFSDPEELKNYENAILIHTPMRIIDAVKYGKDLYSVFPEEEDE